MRQAVFLDRDGVLNKLSVRNGRRSSPLTLDEFEVLPGAALTAQMLKRAGLLVVVVTNQPDVARGLLAPAELERMHVCLRRLVSVDAVYTCPHDDLEGCPCRKPKPGLLLRASQEWGISLGKSYLVGDSWRDIEAGRAAGCETFLVESDQNDCSGITADFVVPNLQVAAEMIAAKYAREPGQLN